MLEDLLLDADATLVEHLDRAGRDCPDRVAWTFDLGPAGCTRWTYAQVAGTSTAYADALAARGVGRGDRVAVMLGNVPESPLLWLALQRLGAATVPLNVRYRHDDLAHVLHDSGARLVVAAPEHHELVASCGGRPWPRPTCCRAGAGTSLPLVTIRHDWSRTPRPWSTSSTPPGRPGAPRAAY